MMQETKTSEPNKFPVASAPQKTYTYTLKGRFGVAIAVVLMVFIMSLFIMFNLLGSWLGLLVPLFLLPLPVFFSVTMHRQKNGFITIAPDGLTFGGALNFKEGFKRDFSQKDFDKVSHFGWEQIQSVGFTRDLAHPSFLFVELTDGETFYFPLFYFRNDFVVVDKVRRFTGYSGCKDLGRCILYVKQLRAKDAN